MRREEQQYNYCLHLYPVQSKHDLLGLLIRRLLRVFWTPDTERLDWPVHCNLTLTATETLLLGVVETLPFGMVLAVLVTFCGRKGRSGALLLYREAFTWSSDIRLLRQGLGAFDFKSKIAHSS